MADSQTDDELLIANGFDPATLDEAGRTEALQIIRDTDQGAGNQVPQSPPAAKLKPAAKSKAETLYFRSSIAGLSVIVAPPAAGQVAPQIERFQPVLRQSWDGYMQRVGYLMTSDPRAIKICRADHNVEEVDADEYNAVMSAADDDKNKKVMRSSY